LKPPNKLAMKQINKRLGKLRPLITETQIRSGWISYLRQALCMTLAKLAERSQSNLSTVQQIEKREAEGKVTLQTMKKIAAAMDCEFIYAMVPKKDLPLYLKQIATKKATSIIKQADVHMALEDQKVNEDIKERISRLAEDLLQKGDIW
jgi:predicted DNA-binding mobile mystery protein A